MQTDQFKPRVKHRATQPPARRTADGARRRPPRRPHGRPAGGGRPAAPAAAPRRLPRRAVTNVRLSIPSLAAVLADFVIAPLRGAPRH
ncbi:hypothetical protein [Nocardioides sp. TF02-7]|uniref:hypothetical protein n=1 Tax=Nocardioides sp. TF02-7 TaxID=2917724 RepID=UPI001F059A48|nr:hypothetical protein [Nocardioides sp. TF02-7]UMG93389.1 hypothetical protein MF408_03810 [Nocardioides sp. TF02-7]